MNPYPTAAEVQHVMMIHATQHQPRHFMYDGGYHHHPYGGVYVPPPVYLGKAAQCPMGNGFYGGEFGNYPFWGGGGHNATTPPYPYTTGPPGAHGVGISGHPFPLNHGYYSSGYYGSQIRPPGYGLMGYVPR